MLNRRLLVTAVAAGLIAPALLATDGTASAAAARPAHLVAHSDFRGLYLRWRSSEGAVTVEQATNARFTTGRHFYRVHTHAQMFTPYAVRHGARYFFRVRVGKGSATSPWSAVVHARVPKRLVRVRVMTYNLLELSRDGERMTGGNRVSPWSKRRLAVARLINETKPGVIAVQEGSSWVRAKRGPRQVDDLRSALGGAYALAYTETPPSQPHYFRTGRYILYRKDMFSPVGHGWHIDLGQQSWMVYQVLKVKSTGAEFLFTSSHLLHGPGSTANQRRYAETRKLIQIGTNFSEKHHLPVVYAGDFNSHVSPTGAFDGPGVAMRKAHIVNAKDASPRRKQARFNSGNLYHRIPPAHGRNEDYVWATAGEAVVFWREVLRLSHGQFAGTIPSDHNPVVADLLLPY